MDFLDIDAANRTWWPPRLLQIGNPCLDVGRGLRWRCLPFVQRAPTTSVIILAGRRWPFGTRHILPFPGFDSGQPRVAADTPAGLL